MVGLIKIYVFFNWKISFIEPKDTEIEALLSMPNQEKENNLFLKEKEEKKRNNLLAKKRTRERKIKNQQKEEMKVVVFGKREKVPLKI